MTTSTAPRSSGAGLLHAAELAGKKLEAIRLVVSGGGAAAIACVDFFCSLGMNREHVTLVDSRGVIHRGRTDLNRQKQRFAVPDDGRRTLADAMRGADMFMGVSVANIVTPEMLKTMADRPIVFALANPDPEISYFDALKARPDALVATGRSDFPNRARRSAAPALVSVITAGAPGFSNTARTAWWSCHLIVSTQISP